MSRTAIVPTMPGRLAGLEPNYEPVIARVIATPGATIGPEFSAANDGLAHVIDRLDNSVTDALDEWSAATLAGDLERIDHASARFAAAVSLKGQPDALARLKRDVGNAQLRAYRQHAETSYRAAAAAYAAALADLAAVVAVTDPRTDAATLVDATSKQRNAWLNADKLAAIAHERLGTLVLAARLGQANVKPLRGQVNAEDAALSVLALDHGATPTRGQVWETFDQGHDTRGGPLAALLAIGADLEPLPDLASVRPYSRSEPRRPEPEPEPTSRENLADRAQRLADQLSGIVTK